MGTLYIGTQGSLSDLLSKSRRFHAVYLPRKAHLTPIPRRYFDGFMNGFDEKLKNDFCDRLPARSTSAIATGLFRTSTASIQGRSDTSTSTGVCRNDTITVHQHQHRPRGHFFTILNGRTVAASRARCVPTPGRGDQRRS